jgi:hypothetical protein
MSGAVKSGLIFGLVGVLLVIIFSFTPLIGPFLCGPAAAALAGAGAGFLGARWSPTRGGAAAGAIAGGIAGCGSLVGAVASWMILLLIAQAMPGYEEQMQEYLRQQPNSQLTPSDMNTLMNVAGPVMGLCFGVLNLVVSLGSGALVGWLMVRGRSQPTPPVPPQPPVTAHLEE